MMADLMTFGRLLVPKLRIFLRPGRSREARSLIRFAFFTGLGLLFALSMYFAIVWFLRQCLSVELVGALIPKKLMAWVLLVLLSVLLLSATIGSFSTFFLSRDLTLLVSSPVAVGPLYFARFVEMVLHSSWMVVCFGLPVFFAYGKVYQAQASYYAGLAGFFPALILLPTGVGALVASVLTRIFSARRSRDLLILLSMLGFVVVYLMVRASRPERLLDEDSFGSMVEFINMFQAPAGGILPVSWATETLFGLLQGKQISVGGPLISIWLTVGMLMSLNGWVGCALYRTGFARAQEGRVGKSAGRFGRKSRGRVLGSWLDHIGRRTGNVHMAMLVKDLRVFFRDPNQWLQLLLLGALAGVYLLNFGYLKHADFNWFTLYTVNHVLVGLVLAGVAVRFVFPAVSLEGKAYWIVRSAPLRSKAFLHNKLLVHFVPVAVLGLGLTLMTCTILEIHKAFVILSVGFVLAMSLGICALAVGIGAVYPRFDTENPAKIPTGVGGVLYMICGCLFVLGLLLAGFYPTWILYHLAGQDPRVHMQPGWLGLSLISAAILVVGAAWIPMALGAGNLEKREE